MASYDEASSIWRALMGGASRVTQNVAPLGGGVYLLGEKAALKPAKAGLTTGSEAGPYPRPRAWYPNFSMLGLVSKLWYRIPFDQPSQSDSSKAKSRRPNSPTVRLGCNSCE